MLVRAVSSWIGLITRVYQQMQLAVGLADISHCHVLLTYPIAIMYTKELVRAHVEVIRIRQEDETCHEMDGSRVSHETNS